MIRTKKTWIYVSIAALLSSAVLVFGQDRVEAETKTSADFSDLKDLDAATKAKFDEMISAGIFDGVAEGKFGLKDEMNRAQFAKVAALIFGLKVDTSLKTSSFTDVKADDASNGYALPYIEALKAAGISNGTGEGIYNPAGDVTKEQLATFLVRGLGLDEDAKATPGVKDSSVSDWAKGYVALALEKKLLANGADGKFGGTKNATRDLLVLGSYEAKGQYVPPVSPSPSPSATPTATPTATPVPTPTATPYVPPVVPTPTPVVPAIQGHLLGPGTLANSVKISNYEKAAGNELQIVVSGTAGIAPVTGTNISSIANARPYVIGSDIVDVMVGQYIHLYEVNSSGIIVKFASILISNDKIAKSPMELIYPSHYSQPEEGTAPYTAKIAGLNLPDGATAWEIKTSITPFEIPAAGQPINGSEYAAGEDIDISEGKVHILLVAVDTDSNAIGYSILVYNPVTDPGPSIDFMHLQTVSEGHITLTIVFDQDVHSDTTDETDIAQLIESITVTPDVGDEYDLNLEESSIQWSPGGGFGGGGPGGPGDDDFPGPGGGLGGGIGFPTMLMIFLPDTTLLNAGDLVRVNFVEGTLKDSGNNTVSQTFCETEVVGS